MTKKIALIKKDPHAAGGLEKVTALIQESLTRAGADVTLLTSASYKPTRFSKTGRLRQLDAWLSQATSAFDVVFSMDRASYQTHHRAGNGVHAAYLDLRAQKEGWLKNLSFRLSPYHRFELELEKRVFESAATRVIITNSHLVKTQILHYYGADPSKIHVVHNGAAMHTPLTAPPREDRFQFLFIGHNFHRKGLEPLLRVLSLLPTKDFHLSVVGTDKKMQWYQALSRRLNLEKKVTFYGAQKNAAPFYEKADVLVIPSTYDPFANVTIEALSYGLFTISSRANGGHEVLQADTGVIVEDPYNNEELKAALEHAMTRPKTVESALKIRATVAHLDISTQLAKICTLCLS